MFKVCGNIIKNDRSSHRRCSLKEVFLEILKNSQENAVPESLFLIKLQAPPRFLKKRLWRRFLSVNFAKFLRTPFLQNASG